MNGGFFDPPEGEAVRVIATRHAACGQSTRVRLPVAVPARVVRRVHCESCAQDYEAAQVEEIGVELARVEAALEATAPVVVRAPAAAPAPEVEIHEPDVEPELVTIVHVPAAGAPPEVDAQIEAVEAGLDGAPPKAKRRLSLPSPSLPRPSLPRLNPQGRFWRLASIPLAAAAVLGVLLAVQGGESSPDSTAPAAGAASGAADETRQASAGERDGEKSAVSKSSEIVTSSEFSLALPAGWERVDPPSGATFAAVAAGGGADATLWIEKDPKLDFPTFVTQSTAQLEALAGAEPQVIERVPGPTPETSIVRLAADSPPDQPAYEVTLRAAGPYRYYLATTVEPGAAREAIAGVELIVGSFAPAAGLSQ